MEIFLKVILILLSPQFFILAEAKLAEVKCQVPIVPQASIEKSTVERTVPLMERMVQPGTEILIRCHPGYSIENGPDRAVCLHLGIWSGRIGECRPKSPNSRVTCDVPLVDNGSLRILSPTRRLGKRVKTMDRVRAGTRLHLRCHRDYYFAEGSYETRCGGDGSWTVNLGKCLPVSTNLEECGEDPKISNGIVTARTVGTRAIQCNEGYGLVGSGIVRCQRDGHWSYAHNACQRICTHVPYLPNGFISDGKNFAGAKRNVGCVNGYELKGPTTIECNVTGAWSDPGRCEKTCGNPPVIMNGILLEGSTVIGSERKIVCNNGFALSGVSVILCNVHSRWVVGGICRKACGPVPMVLSGTIRQGENSVGAERGVACDVGFVLKGPLVIRCGEDAKWSEPGFCKKESIHMAAELGEVDVVKQLIKNQPELLEAQNAYGDSPLWRAAHNGQLEIVKLLLGEGANIESPGLYRRTPLHEAAALGHVDVVQLLLKHGANIFAKSNSHDSEDMPIHLAAFEGHMDVVRALIQANSDLLNKKDMHGRTPLELAKLSSNARATGVVRYLKSKVCEEEPFIKNGHIGNGSSTIGGERSIHCDSGFMLSGPNKLKCLTNGHWSDAGTCIARVCDPNPRVENGRVSDGNSAIGAERTVSCLHGFEMSGPDRIRCQSNAQWTTPGSCLPSESIFWAASMGHEHVVKVLLEKRPELINQRDRSNNTVLGIASAYGHTGIVQFLMTKPTVNLEARDKDGRTPLALASAKGHLQVVKLLVKRGSQLHAKSYSEDFEDQPIHFAAISGHNDVLEYLISEDHGLLMARNRDGDRPIHRAVVGGHAATVKALLNMGAGLESQNNDGWTPLCHAAAEGNIEIVRLLVDRGANVYARSNADDDEDMPIHLASYFGHINIVNYLVDRKPDLILAKNREGETPINRAAVGGHTSVVEFLLSKGVDIETRGFRGRTPLHEAASKGHLQLVKMLVRYNANITARSDRDTDRGSLPIHLASYFGQLDVVRYLIETKPDLVNAKNARGQTPLEHAIAGGSIHNAQGVVRFLTNKAGAQLGDSVLP